MKIIIVALICALHASASYGQSQQASQFVVVLKEYKWEDGLVSSAGEIERAMESNNDQYGLWHPSGKLYWIPKSACRELSSEEAAIRLMDKKQSLHGELGKMRDMLDRANATIVQLKANAPTQAEQKPTKDSSLNLVTSRSERVKMERAVWEAGLVRSLSLARDISNDDLSLLYPQALQIIQLKNIQSSLPR